MTEFAGSEEETVIGK